MLSVGLLFVTLVGFLSGGVLVDQIETFSRKTEERNRKRDKISRKQKQEQGTGEKKIS